MGPIKRHVTVLAASTLFSGIALGAQLSSEDATTIETSASVDLVSSYIFRGVTLNKNAALQPGVEAAIGDLSVGAWGSVAMDAEEEEGEQEVDIYLSYSFSPTEILSITFGAIEYMYPDSDIDNDREVSVGISLDTPLAPSLTANVGIDGAVEETNYYEFGLSQDVYSSGDFSTGLAAALGYLDPAEGEAGLSHAQLVASASYKFLSASANYFVETDDEVQSFEEAEDFYLSVGTAYSF